MPTDGCSVHMPTIINSKLRGAEQDCVPYMMKVILTNIPAECEVVDLYVYRFLFSTPELRVNNDKGHVHKTTICKHPQSLPTNRHAHRTTEHTGHALTSEHADSIS